jgi:hypothetical protein
MREELRRPIAIHVRSDKRSARCRNASRTSCTHSPRERLTEGSDGRNTLARALSPGCDTRARAERALNGRTGRACLGVAGSCTLVARFGIRTREACGSRVGGSTSRSACSSLGVPSVRRSAQWWRNSFLPNVSGGPETASPSTSTTLGSSSPTPTDACLDGEPERLGRTFATRFDAKPDAQVSPDLARTARRKSTPRLAAVT